MRHWNFRNLPILWHKCHLDDYLEIYVEACFCPIDQEMPLHCHCIFSYVLMDGVCSSSISGALMMSSRITEKQYKALLCSRWGLEIKAKWENAKWSGNDASVLVLADLPIASFTSSRWRTQSQRIPSHWQVQDPKNIPRRNSWVPLSSFFKPLLWFCSSTVISM